MPKLSSFDYAIVRVVPHVEREEFFNVGVILFCPTRRFLQARIRFDPERLTPLAPDIDTAMIQEQLALIPRICAGGADAGALGALRPFERFQWLAAPRSTTIQVSPIHCGLADDLEAALDDLFERLVSTNPNE
ncbi:MAG: DUF3037 domain-containing protein [Chloroflexi bacterium]|nr:DUF3037 domain-containing protein [Chloroflexota bacterium]